MKMTKQLMVWALLTLLLVPAAVFGQEQAPERGVVEFGVRGVTGTVDGSDRGVPFSNGFRPDLLNSSLNTYNDYRNGFYVPRFSMRMNDFLGTKSYLSLQSQSNGLAFSGTTPNRDQSFLATFGHDGLYKLQFRWDETPHIFSGTTRTIFANGGRGVWTVDPSLRTALFNVALLNSVGSGSPTTAQINNMSNAILGAVAGTLVPGVAGAQLFTQQESRKTGTGLASWNITPNWSTFFLFSRENQVGTRPIGMIMGSSPASSGKFFEVEVPEQIDYFTTNIKVGSEFGKKNWDVLLGYQTSLFHNNTPSMLVSNPFSSPTATLSQMQNLVGPDTTRMDLYPDNSYQQLVAGGAADLGKYIRFMASITPGVMTQDASFQPTTTATTAALLGASLNPVAGFPNLPQPNLNGRVQTLAMNYTTVLQARKNLQLVAKYQQYDYDNQTPELLVRDVVGDTALANSAGCSSATTPVQGITVNGYCPTEQSSFHRKTFDVSGTYFLTKKNSAKVGYQREWMNRTNRNVGESIENSLYAAGDLNLRKDLLLRVSGRHQNRMPQNYAYAADGINISHPYERYLDEATRIRNRGDVSLQWNATEKLNVSVFWGTLQDNYNVRDAVNSLTSLNDTTHTPGLTGTSAPVVPITPVYGPYYAYGLLNNRGTNFGADANYVLTKNVVVFAEYVREHNRGRIVNGNYKGMLPYTAGLVRTCQLNASGYWTLTSTGSAASGCDPINDVNIATKDVVNTYFAGADFTVSKKINVSVYYSLSASQSNINADGMNCQLVGHGTPVAGTPSYCKTNFVNWNLDTAADPALTFSFPENVNRIHEVGAIAKFKLTHNLVPKFQYTFRMFTNVDWQTGVINPSSFVGTATDPTSISILNRFLLLGADQPSYRAHILSATLEYHF